MPRGFQVSRELKSCLSLKGYLYVCYFSRNLQEFTGKSSNYKQYPIAQQVFDINPIICVLRTAGYTSIFQGYTGMIQTIAFYYSHCPCELLLV